MYVKWNEIGFCLQLFILVAVTRSDNGQSNQKRKPITIGMLCGPRLDFNADQKFRSKIFRSNFSHVHSFEPVLAILENWTHVDRYFGKDCTIAILCVRVITAYIFQLFGLHIHDMHCETLAFTRWAAISFSIHSRQIF